MTLRDLKPGQFARVKSITAEGSFKRRIMDMGITSGIEIQMVKVAPLGDPIEVTLRGYQLSLRKNEAESIEITTEGCSCSGCESNSFN
ncbi:MAG: ferrous iron transport protein A [Spirochaetaceae bacterium]|nr:ferrous iron transport protein A [Spirochaetaceae bacterium]